MKKDDILFTIAMICVIFLGLVALGIVGAVGYCIFFIVNTYTYTWIAVICGVAFVLFIIGDFIYNIFFSKK